MLAPNTLSAAPEAPLKPANTEIDSEIDAEDGTGWSGLEGFTLDGDAPEAETPALESVENPQDEMQNTIMTILDDVLKSPDHYTNPNQPYIVNDLTEALIAASLAISSNKPPQNLGEAFGQVTQGYENMAQKYADQDSISRRFVDKARVTADLRNRYAVPQPTATTSVETPPATTDTASENSGAELDPNIIS